MLGAALNFPVTLCMPSNVSPERKSTSAYGAEVIWTNPANGSDGAIRKARELIAAEPDRYFYADQYGNDENWRAHYRTTANEIWEQTEGQITHFVAGLGTSGTFMGTTRRLRELNPDIRCISMQPDSPFNGLEGLKHMATAIVPKIYDAHLADANIDMDTEVAYAMSAILGRNHGLLVGISAAAAVAASLQVAEQEAAAGREAVIVTVLCDSAEKYMSERFWKEGEAGRKPTHAAHSSTLAELRAHGEETYPNECCGVLLGKSKGVEGNQSARSSRAGNTRTDSAHNRYNIAPHGARQNPASGPQPRPRHRGLLPLAPRPPRPVVPHRLRRGPLARLLLRHHRRRKRRRKNHQLLPPPRHHRRRQSFREPSPSKFVLEAI